MNEFIIDYADVFLLRSKINEPVVTSFGKMETRSAVLIRIIDNKGYIGWGEAWCNFPTYAAESRVNFFTSELISKLLGRRVSHPKTVFLKLLAELRAISNQSGDYGTVSQVLAGIDLALWDIRAQRNEQPLWKLLGGIDNYVEIYASGINPNNPGIIVEKKLSEGYTRFKLKIGFNPDLDRQNLDQIRKLIGPARELMADANQAWTPNQAKSIIQSLKNTKLVWLEEPLPADSSISDWKELVQVSPFPIAIGENFYHYNSFLWAIESKLFGYIQPDISKWGGISGCLEIGRIALKRDVIFCPHWLGSGVGLLASAHLLAGVGGQGYLEVDANINPLQNLFEEGEIYPIDGKLFLTDTPGLGKTLSLEALRNLSGLEQIQKN